MFDPSLPGDVVPLLNKDLMQNRIPTIEISSLHCFTFFFLRLVYNLVWKLYSEG